MSIDYSLFYRRPVDPNRISQQLPVFDVMISAFNTSARVQNVFAGVKAKNKTWFVQPEYRFVEAEIPSGFSVASPQSLDERRQVAELLVATGSLAGAHICVDVTGFMRHTLLFLVAKLASIGVKSFTALYSEPDAYIKQEHTPFSTTTTGIVRPVHGMRGTDLPSHKEYLIVLVGYDHKLIGQVADNKDGAEVLPIFAFPSLSPDMYQQSAVRTSASGEVALEASWVSNRRFAPANDPFATAGIISESIFQLDRSLGKSNFYLSPLSTKVQALGAALFWILEGQHRGGVSLLMPECETYTRETSRGLKRLWSFDVELA